MKNQNKKKPTQRNGKKIANRQWYIAIYFVHLIGWRIEVGNRKIFFNEENDGEKNTILTAIVRFVSICFLSP